MQKCDSLAGTFKNLPVEENDLTKFKELIAKKGVTFKNGIALSGSTKVTYPLELNELKSNFKDNDLKKQLTELFDKI